MSSHERSLGVGVVAASLYLQVCGQVLTVPQREAGGGHSGTFGRSLVVWCVRLFLGLMDRGSPIYNCGVYLLDHVMER